MTDLLVLLAGALCVSAGAAWVFPPAGLMVLGLLLIAFAWPESGGDA